MKRRSLLAGVGSACASLAVPVLGKNPDDEPGVTRDTITIGNSMGLTGILAASAASHVAGLQAAFKTVNQAGGIAGRQLRLLSKDDGYVPARTGDNVRGMLERQEVLALVSVQGTGNTAQASPFLEKYETPLVGPITGAYSLRTPDRKHIFHVKASYRDEAVRMVDLLKQVNLTNIAIVYLDNVYGREALSDLEYAVKLRNARHVGTFKMAADGSNGEALARQVADAKPELVALAITGTATTAFVVPFRALAPGTSLVGNSVTFLPAEVKKMGSIIRGSALTLVMPEARSPKMGMTRKFHAAMKAAGTDTNLNSSALESWANAQVLIEGLRRCGKELSRQRLTAALATIHNWNLGDFIIDYSAAAPFVGSKYVGLGVLSADGQIRI